MGKFLSYRRLAALLLAQLLLVVGPSFAQQATISGPGIAQIALARAQAGTTTPFGADTTPLNSPVQVNLPIAAGQAIQVSGSGLVGYGRSNG